MFRLITYSIMLVLSLITVQAQNNIESILVPKVFEHIHKFYEYTTEEIAELQKTRTQSRVEDEDYILPNTTRPFHYNIRLSTEIDKGIYDFQGKVEIYINTIETTDTIVIHSRYANILGVSIINQSSGQNIPVREHMLDEELEFLRIFLNDTNLLIGEIYILSIEYESTLRLSAQGFYGSSYLNASNERVYLAATQFEPLSAHFAFPCYDEIALKATFQITIDHSCSYHALSNMPENSIVVNDDNICTTQFDTTKVMSTYLIAFVVSDFASIENYSGPLLESRLKHRIFRPTNQYANGIEFSLKTSEDVLTYMEEYFGHPYTFPKMDQIGVPSMGGAMENWGLVIYNPQWLYYDNTTQSRQAIFDPLETIVHELTHMWFGNLVTPEEWGYLWMKEGFAQFYGFYLVDKIYEDIQYFAHQQTSSCSYTKITDARNTTRSMSTIRHDYNFIRNTFDNIAYTKSACVIHMWMHALSEERFKEGLKNYLTENAYEPVNPDHLSGQLHSVGQSFMPDNINIVSFIDSWHTQAGIPILNVDYNIESGAINITQERYKTEEIPNSNLQKWIIPYNFITSADVPLGFEITTPDNWLSEFNEVLTPTDSRNWKDEEWVLFNKQATGYYRINYNTENWKSLAKAMTNENAGYFHFKNRQQLVEDSFVFAADGVVNFDIPINLLSYLSAYAETNPFVWITIASGLQTLHNNLYGVGSYYKFENYLKTITEKSYNALNFIETPQESINYHYFRTNIITLACRSALEKCLDDTAASLKENYDTTNMLSGQTNYILSWGSRNADRETILKIWKSLENDITSNEESMVLTMLANTGDELLFEGLLNSLLLDNGSVISDVNVEVNYDESTRAVILYYIVIMNPRRIDQVIDFVIDNFDEFKKRTPISEITYIYSIADHVKTQIRYEKFSQLLQLYVDVGGINESTLETLMTSVTSSMEWADKHEQYINAWMDDNGFNSSSTNVISTLALLLVTVISFLNL